MSKKGDGKYERLKIVTAATRFQKGQSGNPGGRPKKAFSMTALVLAELEKPEFEQHSGVQRERTRGEAIAANIVQMATIPSTKVFPYQRLIWEYVDGLPKDSVRMSMEDLAKRLAADLGDVTAEEILEDFAKLTGTDG